MAYCFPQRGERRIVEIKQVSGTKRKEKKKEEKKKTIL